MTKRNVSVTVKMSAEDFALLKKAGAKLAHDVPITNSTLVLTLAKRQAEQILKGKK